MFKSKHSGWTWDLKRTPFGGGGGGGFSGITDSISSALGTDGSGGGALGALASIDPGPAIGSAGASIDQAVNQIPGGWYTVGALAAGGTALAFAPEIAAAAGVSADTAITSAAGQQAFFDSLAAGGTSADAIGAGVAADAAAAAGAAGSSAYGLNAGAPTVGAGSPSGIAATQSAAGLGGSGTGIIEGLAPTSVGMGGTTGAGSLAGIAGSEAAVGLGGANLGMGLTADQLASYEAANPSANPANLSKLTNLLKSGAGSGLANSLGQLSQGANPQGMALPNLVRGNQNPFTYTAQQPIQNAQPMDLSALSKLLKQG